MDKSVRKKKEKGHLTTEDLALNINNALGPHLCRLLNLIFSIRLRPFPLFPRWANHGCPGGAESMLVGVKDTDGKEFLDHKIQICGCVVGREAD